MIRAEVHTDQNAKNDDSPQGVICNYPRRGMTPINIFKTKKSHTQMPRVIGILVIGMWYNFSLVMMLIRQTNSVLFILAMLCLVESCQMSISQLTVYSCWQFRVWRLLFVPTGIDLLACRGITLADKTHIDPHIGQAQKQSWLHGLSSFHVYLLFLSFDGDLVERLQPTPKRLLIVVTANGELRAHKLSK